jgi:coenzyme F420-0:L-glutamate ligase/coenzyme F420-1:gamma-L-glutamate ligase
MHHPPDDPGDVWRHFSSIATSRRSYKQPFANKDIAPSIIKRCIDLARWAPSAHNAQPWRFMPFYRQDPRHQALKTRVLYAIADRYASDLANGGTATQQATEAANARNTKFRDAPVLVLAFTDASAMDTYPDERRSNAEAIMGIQSTAAALTTFLLALHAAGLGACWYCAPLFAQSIIEGILQVPGSWHAQAFIGAGYKAGDGTPDVPKDGRMPGAKRMPVDKTLIDPYFFLDITDRE